MVDEILIGVVVDEIHLAQIVVVFLRILKDFLLIRTVILNPTTLLAHSMVLLSALSAKYVGKRVILHWTVSIA
jgi:hypothetical protein